MSDLVEAARNGDFLLAKEIYDKNLAAGQSAVSILSAVDRRHRSVAHYAAEYDEAVVIEWLHNMGVDLFSRDDSNKSPVEIAVLVDAKLRKKRKSESEVLNYMKAKVLNPIQKMFFLECGESTTSVSNVSDLEALSPAQLAERFPFHNNLQALHLFAMNDRLVELRYLKSRNVDMNATDDDGNTALHFASSYAVALLLVQECGANIDALNSSDGYTPAHSIVSRAAMGEVGEPAAVTMLELLVSQGADFSIKSESEEMGVTELAIDLFDEGPIVDACAQGKGALTGASLAAYRAELQTHENEEEDDDLSVASHDDKVIGENGEESESESESDDEGEENMDAIAEANEDEESGSEDFFIRRK